MGSEEVVVGHEQDGEGDGSIEVLEAATGAGVELIGTVEALNDLFELAVFSSFGVLICQADDGASFQGQGGALEQSGVVDGMGGGVIGGVAVADEFGGGVWRHGPEGFGEGDERMLSAPGIGEVIGMNGAAGGADSEPGVIPAIGHADIGFIAGDTRIDRAFVKAVKPVAEHGGLAEVVEHGDVREADAEDMLEHVGGHT